MKNAPLPLMFPSSPTPSTSSLRVVGQINTSDDDWRFIFYRPTFPLPCPFLTHCAFFKLTPLSRHPFFFSLSHSGQLSFHLFFTLVCHRFFSLLLFHFIHLFPILFHSTLSFPCSYPITFISTSHSIHSSHVFSTFPSSFLHHSILYLLASTAVNSPRNF